MREVSSRYDGSRCTRVRCPLLLTLTVILLGPLAAGAAGLAPLALGARAGTSVYVDRETFHQYELYAQWALPWSGRWRGWDVESRLNAAAGALTAGGATGFVGSIGPGVALTRVVGGRLLTLEGGVSPTLLSRHVFAIQDLGDDFQFTVFLSGALRFGPRRNISVGYRFHHMSNAGLSDPNPGINLHVLELGYYFR